MIEEYEAGMILNESLLIRLAYLFDENKDISIKSHTDTCPYCSMPVDSHDKFCHFCGINLEYEPNKVLDSLLDTVDVMHDEFDEDIRYVSYKFLKLINEGIELEYSIFTIENTYNIDWDILKEYLSNQIFDKCPQNECNINNTFHTPFRGIFNNSSAPIILGNTIPPFNSIFL